MNWQSSLVIGGYSTPDEPFTATRFVAPSGMDQGDCLDQTYPCRTPQYAVDQAAIGDEIRLSQGTYSDLEERNGFIQIVYISKTITLSGGYTLTNWTVPDLLNHPSILDARRQGRVLFITGPISVTLEGLRIIHGNASGAPANRDGGGIFILDASTTISACQVISNTAEFHGGGIFHNGEEFYLINSQIISNTSVASGGGVFTGPPYFHNYQDTSFNAAPGRNQLDSNGNTSLIRNNLFSSNIAGFEGGGIIARQISATLTMNTFAGNTGYRGGGLFIDYSNMLVRSNIFQDNHGAKIHGQGGGVYSNYSNSTFEDNKIQGNDADQGGGLYLYYSDTSLLRNNVISNSASLVGGGIYSLDTPTTLDRNLIASNSTARFWGGGMVMDGSNFTMTNNLIVDNHSADYGSGLQIDRVSIGRMLHNTIARNTGRYGDGLMIASNSHITLTNTILVSQTNGILLLSRESSAHLEATLWGSGIWANGTDWYSDGALVTGTVNLWGNPGFINPDAGNYHLGYLSDAIDTGIDSGIANDIDGDERPSLFGYDIGADEFTGEYLIYLPLLKRETINPNR